MEEGYIYLEKIKLSRPWIRLRVISYLCWFFKFENIRRCLAFSGEVHRWILKWHTKKNECLDMTLGL